VLAATTTGLYVSKNGQLGTALTFVPAPPAYGANLNKSFGLTLISPNAALGYAQAGAGELYSNQGTICFNKDSKILCFVDNKETYLPIQDIRKGTLVKTLTSGYKPVDMIGSSKMSNPASADRIKNQLYVLRKEAYPELTEDLILTGCHCVLVDHFKNDEQKSGVAAVNGNIYITEGKYRLPACVDDRAAILQKADEFTIYHLALEHTDYYMNYGVYANGLLVETCSQRYLKELSAMTLLG
jgi:hypothetical protein